MLRSLRCMLILVIVAGVVTLALGGPAPKVKYDPATETKVSGTIEDVQEFQCPVSGTIGFHISLRSGDRVQTVHVAASKFLRDYEIHFEKGEKIEVTGSRVKLDTGEEGILAKEIKRGQNIFAFRDKEGKPLW